MTVLCYLNFTNNWTFPLKDKKKKNGKIVKFFKVFLFPIWTNFTVSNSSQFFYFLKKRYFTFYEGVLFSHYFLLSKQGKRTKSILLYSHICNEKIHAFSWTKMQTASSVILRTGAIVEFRRSQGWRTHENISCHQSLGTWVWRSKMSRTSLVQAEWPVEFRCDFDIITHKLSRATLLFSLVWPLRIDPSNRYIRNQVTRFWAVQIRFLNRFNRGPWHPDPCHTQPVSNTNDMKVTTSQLQRRRCHRQEVEEGRTLSNKLF